MPEAQRNACLSSPWKDKWDVSDPVRFEPPFIVVDITGDGEKVCNLSLDIDHPLVECFKAKLPQLFSYAAFPNDEAIIQKFELASVEEADATHTYHFHLYLNLSLLKKNRGLNELIKIAVDPDWEQSNPKQFSQYAVFMSNNINGSNW